VLMDVADMDALMSAMQTDAERDRHGGVPCLGVCGACGQAGRANGSITGTPGEPFAPAWGEECGTKGAVL
jgi:hypothetical protein